MKQTPKPTTPAPTERQIASETYYRNPFWSDPHDPNRDSAILNAICVRANAEIDRNARRTLAKRLTALVSVCTAAVLAVQGVLWRLHGSDNQNAGLVMAAIVTPFAAVLIVRSAHRRVDAPLSVVEPAMDLVRSGSWDRYQEWLKALASSDAQRYDRIVQWQQREDLIAAQQHQFQLAQQQLLQAQAQQRDLQLLGAYVALSGLNKPTRR